MKAMPHGGVAFAGVVPGAGVSSAAVPSAAIGAQAPSDPTVEGLIAGVRGLRVSPDSAGLVDQLRGLEELKAAIGAAQARVAVAFDVAQRREQAEAGIPVAGQGQGVAAQVALARGESPSRGGRCSGWPRRWWWRCRVPWLRWMRAG
jgi:hypothetical protein